MNKKLVSVVISTYKRKNELIRAIESVCNQTYKNCEIIIVDDNGRGTEYQKYVENVVNTYLSKGININYIINEENIGGALSRNNGIDSANGEYIAFLDDDDEYYPKKIEKQVNLFESQNNEKLALVYCYTESFDENNKKIREYRNDSLGNCLYDAMVNCIAATSQWMCRKKHLLDVGKFTNVPSKQDSTLMIKLLERGYEINRVPEILVKYNEHSNFRISSGGLKNIEGEELLRKYCRSLYYKIKSKQIIKIEASFSYRLSKLYIRNNLKDKLYEEIETLKLTNKKDLIKIVIYYYLTKFKLI